MKQILHICGFHLDVLSCLMTYILYDITRLHFRLFVLSSL